MYYVSSGQQIENVEGRTEAFAQGAFFDYCERVKGCWGDLVVCQTQLLANPCNVMLQENDKALMRWYAVLKRTEEKIIAQRAKQEFI